MAKQAKKKTEAKAEPVASSTTTAAADKAVVKPMARKTRAQRSKKPAATRASKPARGRKDARNEKSAPKTTAAPRGRRGRRYSDAERTMILATAQREGLSGAAVSKRFGVSALTYYTWRKKSGKPTATRNAARRGHPPVSGFQADGSLLSEIRNEVRRRLEAVLPQIMAGEIDGLLGGASRRGR